MSSATGLEMGVGVGFDGGVGDEIGLSVPAEESFTDVVGTAASKGVVTEPMLRLLEFDDDVLEGREAGTTPLLPVRPSQRPWHEDVVDPEPVVAACRPWPMGKLPASGVPVVVVPVVVVPVVVVPVVVVPVVVVPVVVVVGVVVVGVVVVPVVVVPVVVVPVVVVPVVVVPVVVVPVVVVVGVVAALSLALSDPGSGEVVVSVALVVVVAGAVVVVAGVVVATGVVAAGGTAAVVSSI